MKHDTSIQKNGHTRLNILGVLVSSINMENALSILDTWIENHNQYYVCVTGVHGLIEAQRNAGFRQILNQAGMVTPDGMPLVWLNRLHGYKHVDRVYGPDLMLAACRKSLEKGWSHYFYGSGPGVADQLADRLSEKYPGLKIAGKGTPPFHLTGFEESSEIIERINQAKADILWVGLSTPKQEQWMVANFERIHVPVMIGVGAAFDFHAGIKKQAPRWMQRGGLEWLFRLLSEPGRLWKRYLVNNPLFIFLILLQVTGLKKYSIDREIGI